MSSFLTAIGVHGAADSGPEQLRHLRHIPARAGVTAPWPGWVHPEVRAAYERLGAVEAWEHQVQAANSIWEAEHTIVATGTASGKSLAYTMPVLSVLCGDPEGATALYLSPTKALAADQLNTLRALGLKGLRAEVFDGDTEPGARTWIREHANYVLTNPDMLHFGVLPNHTHWARFFRRLKFVIVDEAHSYRGVFGSHVANVMRRLKRICARYGASPVFVGASATAFDPAVSFGRLVGEEILAFERDCSPSGAKDVLLWEPALTQSKGEHGAPVRRSSLAEVSDLFADLVVSGTRTLAFVKSRKGAEAISSLTISLLEEVDPALGQRVAAYRSGYLPEERRELERRLRTGELLGVASTPALEMGVDISGLDAVLVAGWPGTRASFMQQIGRAGRSGDTSLSVLVASDDPLDTYLVHHPEMIFETPVEAAVFDSENPYILGPHLCAAAQELPLTTADLALFGESTQQVLGQLTAQGFLRLRPAGWFWTHPQSAAGMVNLRSDGGGPVNIIDADTGALLGHMDSPQTHYHAHPGAVYVHQGQSFMVMELNEQDHVVLVQRANPDFTTTARDVTSIEIRSVIEQMVFDGLSVCFGEVQVQTQVVSFQRKAIASGEVLGEEPLDLDARDLITKAVWFEIEPRLLFGQGVEEKDFPGALHAAEHAGIGLLPLIATSDRWDIGGVSTALHADTAVPTIFVYDGHPGGVGIAERGYDAVVTWLESTRAAILACECESGCPSCVQSPKCGNRNEPLSKDGAVRTLTAILKGMEAGPAAAAAPNGEDRP